MRKGGPFGGNLNVTGGEKAAGIGGGKSGNGGDVTLYAGELMVSGGASAVAIGAGYDGSNNGTITWGNVRLFTGTSAGNYDNIHVASAHRSNFCAKERFVKIETCYIHKYVCAYCTYCGDYSQYETTKVTYVNRTWNDSSVVEETASMEAQDIAKFLSKNAESITSANVGWRTLYVSGKVDLSNYSLLVHGNGGTTNLILCDDADLTVHNIFMMDYENRLHIYGQANDTGKLTINPGKTTCAYGRCGIGQSPVTPRDNIFGGFNIHFHGGHILSYGADGGCGIGADTGYRNNKYFFYGGYVEAWGDGKAAEGIGGHTEEINIYGGKVIGHGCNEGAGIGGNSDPYLENHISTGIPRIVVESPTYVYIYGGDVEAYGGEDAAAIGGNWKGVGRVRIHGGKVKAIAQKNGAGIGGGRNTIGNIIITGGDVTAYGGHYGAGIGSSSNGSE